MPIDRVVFFTLAWMVISPVRIVADEAKPFAFRGVVPGDTTGESLRANPRWGAPRKEKTNADGSLSWQYHLPSYKEAIITVRGGRVQTVDVVLPDGVGIDEAAAALKLGIPVEGAALSEAAQVGTSMPQNWEPVVYSAGRVALFVDRQRGQAMALRSYAGELLDNTPSSVTPTAGERPSAQHGQSNSSREIIAGLARVFPQQHISGHPVDGEIGKRTLRLFVDELDPSRVYFTRDDVVRMGRNPDEFAEQLRQGDLTRVYEIFRDFLERVDQRRELFEKLVAADQDFTVDEEFDFTPYADNWAENDLELREAWRKRVKYELLTHLEAGATDEEAKDRLTRQMRARWDKWRALTDDQLFSLATSAFCGAFDPRSTFYTPREWKDSMIGLASQMVGIGASLQVNYGYTEVVKVIAGGPAGVGGRLREGDCIVAVAEGDQPFVEAVGMPLSDVVDRIRGTEGTKVRLRVLSKDNFETKIVELTRRRFETQKLGSAVLKSDVTGREGSAKIGYLYIPTVYTDIAAQDAGRKDYRSTARDLQKMLSGLVASDVDVAVVDLRDNPGGTLRESIEVAGQFVGVGPVVVIRDGQGRAETYKPEAKPTVWDRPLVVLTNRGTSGGAEIIAAAVQDYQHGLVVGDTTTNRNGTIATQKKLAELLGAQAGDVNPDRLGVARITVQKFYRINGDGIQGRGVVPDIGLPSATEVTGVTQMDQPYSLSFNTATPATFTPVGSIDKATIDQLTAASQQRRAGSEYFQKLSEQIQAAGNGPHKTVTSLNKDKFLADRRQKARDADAKAVPGVPDVKLTPYLQEVFAVALDFAAEQHYANAEAAIKERKVTEALGALRRAVAANPQMKPAHNRLAWALATWPDRKIRNGQQAVAEARQLCELDGRNNWTYLLTLAVAEAEAGNFKQAETELDAALEKAPESQQAKYAYLRDRFRRKQSFASQ